MTTSLAYSWTSRPAPSAARRKDFSPPASAVVAVPPSTGMEPDCAFYVGERATAYRDALIEGEAQADAFLDHTAPDLVVEVELTNMD